MPKQIKIKATALKKTELHIWRALHADDDGMMYPLPSSDAILWKRLRGANAHLVRDQDGTLVGCFSVSVQADGIATGGTAVRSALRRRGIGSQILTAQEDLARILGAHSFRCDVFSDNAAGVALMARNGYRNFQWFEKPLIAKTKKG